MPGGGIHLRSVRALEQELQCELNQPRGVVLGIDYPKPVAPARDERRPRETELNAIEGIEELRPELNPEPVFRTEGGRLEEGNVPVVDTGGRQGGIDTGLIAVSIVRRLDEAGRVEPLAQLGRCAPRSPGTLVTSLHYVRPDVRDPQSETL